jgi:hypothetical protein
VTRAAAAASRLPRSKQALGDGALSHTALCAVTRRLGAAQGNRTGRDLGVWGFAAPRWRRNDVRPPFSGHERHGIMVAARGW